VTGNQPVGFEENTMDANDTKNASLLFSTVRRSNGRDFTLVPFLAAWLVVGAAMIAVYQNPEASASTPRVTSVARV
jgi:hypothetical protein